MSKAMIGVVAIGLGLSLLMSVLGISLIVAAAVIGLDLPADITIDDFEYKDDSFQYTFEDISNGVVKFEFEYTGDDPDFRFTFRDPKGELMLDIRYNPDVNGITRCNGSVSVIGGGDWVVKIEMDNVRSKMDGKMSHEAEEDATSLCLCAMGPIVMFFGSFLFLIGIILGGISLWRGRRNKKLEDENDEEEEYERPRRRREREDSYDDGRRDPEPRRERSRSKFYDDDFEEPNDTYRRPPPRMITCPRCGTPNAADAMWCVRCGLTRTRGGGGR